MRVDVKPIGTFHAYPVDSQHCSAELVTVQLHWIRSTLPSVQLKVRTENISVEAVLVTSEYRSIPILGEGGGNRDDTSYCLKSKRL